MLVVRVKRYRYDDPAEELCVFEDNTAPVQKRKRGGITAQLAALNTAVESGSNNKDEADFPSTAKPTIVEEKRKQRIILRRVSTLDSVTTKAAIDTETVKMFHEGRDMETDASQNQQSQRKRAKVIVAQGGSKSLPIAGRESCIVVDMMQITNMKELEAKRAAEAQLNAASSPTIQSQPQSKAPTPSKTKVLDPATRALARGIQTAIKNGDFNDISDALLQGANPDYQQENDKGGYTALMVACMKCNLRMVKRLLVENINVLACNKDGQMAIDLVKENRFNTSDAREIKIALQAAMVKAHKQNNKASGQNSDGTALLSPTSATGMGDFVIDIYCIKNDAMEVDGDEGNDPPGASSESIKETENSEDNQQSVVHIEGLRIMEDGQVELVSYDSDWSDLADDEDPDSNDERHFANDYPDESDEDNGGTLFDDGDDDDDPVNNDVDSDEDYETMKKQFRHKKDQYLKSRKQVNQEIEDELEAVLAEGERTGEPVFDRHKAIGRVMRPHSMGMNEGHDSESLRAMWGLDDDGDDDEDNVPLKQRIQQMRVRTGMAFASNPREFNETGLPKYGFDLSDDDENRMDMVHGGSYAKPAKDAVAYDSEMDQSDSD